LKRWWRWLIGLLLVGALAAWLVMRRPPPPPAPLPLATVERGDVTQTVRAVGQLQPRVKVDVGAQVSGQVLKLHVQLGETVRRGDPLVSLDPELARSELAQTEAQLAQQQALLDARRVDADAARREAERQRRLLAQQATAAIEAERADDELARLEADLRGQAATLKRLQAELENKRLRLGYTRITAPSEGTVIGLPVPEGQTVIAAQQTPVLVTLAQMDTMTVRVRVPEAEITKVQPGLAVSFTTLAREPRSYAGRVRVIQPVPERVGNAAFYNVLFEVDNRDRALLADMTVQAAIETGGAKQATLVPVLALGARAADGRYQVLVQQGGGEARFEPRHVRVGITDGLRAQVTDGLKPGERVMLSPPAPADRGTDAAPVAARGS